MTGRRRSLRSVLALAMASIAAAACGLSVVGSGTAPQDAGAAEASGADGTSGPIGPSSADGASAEIPEGGTEIALDPLDAGDEAGVDAGPPALEIIAPTGGKYTVFPPGSSTPCTKSGLGTTLQIENRTGAAIRVYWYDYLCVEEDYGKVNKDQGFVVGTFVGHRWRVRRDSDRQLLADFVLDATVAPGARYRAIVR